VFWLIFCNSNDGWVELPIQHPPFCLAHSGRENHFAVSGEIIMFRLPVATTIVHAGNKITLHAPVGHILRIEILEAQEPRAIVNLFSIPLLCRLEQFLHRQTTCIYSTIQPKLFGVTTSNGFSPRPVEAFVFLQLDYSTGPAGVPLGMENSFYCLGFLEMSPTRRRGRLD
jgi:hypothetical protein